MLKNNQAFKAVQFIIFLAHIFLLGWILYTLYEGGRLGMTKVLLNFLGVAVFGALLIRISALVAKKNYQNSLHD